MTKDECEEIMRPALNAALPKMGLNRHFPRDVLFGSKDFQGLGIPHLYTLQSIKHIQDIIHHQLNPDLTTELHEGTFLYLDAAVPLGGHARRDRLDGVHGRHGGAPRQVLTFELLEGLPRAWRGFRRSPLSPSRMATAEAS